MTAILSALPWRWIGLGAAILGAWLYVSHLRGALADREATISEQRAQLDQIEAANASLAANMEQLKADNLRQIATISDNLRQTALRASRTAQSIQVIRDAPATDDAPVAPVLSRTLDGLRKPGASGDRAKPGGAPVGP